MVLFGDHVAMQAGVVGAAIVLAATGATAWDSGGYLRVGPWLSGALVLTFLSFDLYRTPDMPLRSSIQALARPLFLTAVLGSLAALFVHGLVYPRDAFGLGVAAGCGAVLAWRSVLYRLVARRRGVESALVVVDPEADQTGDQAATLQRLTNSDDRRVTVTAVVDYRDRANLLRRLDGVDIAVVSSAVPPDVRSRLSFELLDAGVRVLVMPAPFDVVLATGRQTHFHALEGVELAPDAPRSIHQFTKRSVDLVVGLIGLIIALPVLATVAIVVRFDSPGAALFSQVRVGRHGRQFRMQKFRTMQLDAEAETGAVLASAEDPRVTRVGRFLRRSRLDELPQLWNVVRGEMSLVGPRPERPEFVSSFERDIPAYGQRHAVRPGITGLAQIRGGYGSSAEEKLRFDLFYINRSTLLDDVRILIRTLALIVSLDVEPGSIAAGAGAAIPGRVDQDLPAPDADPHQP